jgi:hypothetical protein
MAGKGKKTFVAGEVLLAQDVNDYLMDQSVMNFASSAARSSAIPTPTEGMTTYVQDRNQIETFDGAEYRGMSGLQLVKKQAIGTAVASVTVTDAFSATYENYKILISGGGGSGNGIFSLQLSGQTAAYYAGTSGTNYSNNTFTGVSVNNGSLWTTTGNHLSNALYLNVDLYNPFLAKKTTMTAHAINFNSFFSFGQTVGECSLETSATGFVVSTSTGTITGGTIYVYGYGT